MEEYRQHFKEVSDQRFERSPREIEEAIAGLRDIKNEESARRANERMNEPPTEEEIWKAIKVIKDSAPGEDNVIISYICHADRELKKQITKLVQFMFDNNAETWEESLKMGDMVPTYKKGNKEIPSNYRGFVLLAMTS